METLAEWGGAGVDRAAEEEADGAAASPAGAARSHGPHQQVPPMCLYTAIHLLALHASIAISRSQLAVCTPHVFWSCSQVTR